MSFFQKPSAPPPPTPSFTPPQGGSRGDRTLAVRVKEPEVPVHRENGVKPTAHVDRLPEGKLFSVAGGWFDRYGYWCVPLADGQVRVTRGAPRKINRLLSKEQRRELERARLQARRKGVR